MKTESDAIDGAAPDLSDSAALGARLRDVRQAKGLTLQELSRRSGIALSTLSKAERGLAALTYDRIVHIAAGLGLDFGELFDTSAVPFRLREASVMRHGAAPIHETPYYTYSMAHSGAAGKQMIPMFGRIHARGVTEFKEMISHPGEEFTTVLDGVVELHLENHAPIRLERYDSVYFDSTLEHAYVSVGPGEAFIVCVCVGLPEDRTAPQTEPASADEAALTEQAEPS